VTLVMNRKNTFRWH